MTTREIKFRAWDGREKMYYPTTFEFGVSGVNGLTSIAVPLNGGGFCTTAYIMQYTGLKDKNGKEIYEGDIIQTASEDILVVIWNKNFASFCLQKDGWLNDHYFGEAVEPMDCVVIGNIYENPKLLEQKI